MSYTLIHTSIMQRPILADDIAVLSNIGAEFQVQLGYPRLRLWKSAVNALYGSELELPRVYRDTDKHFVELNQNGASEWRFHSKPLPLAAIYILGERHALRLNSKCKIHSLSKTNSRITISGGLNPPQRAVPPNHRFGVRKYPP